MSQRDYVASRGQRDPRIHAEIDVASAELAIGEALVRRRHEQDLPIAELAEKTGIRPDRLEAIEEGEDMALHEVLWLLHALDLSLAIDSQLVVTSQAPRLVRRSVG